MDWSLVICCPAYSFELKGKQCKRRNFVSPTILYSIRYVYIMSECMRTMSSAKFSFSCLFPLKFIPNLLPTSFQKVWQVRTKKFENTFFNSIVNLNFLRSSRLINCFATSVMVLSLLYDCVRIFNIIRKGRIQMSFQIT